MNAFYIIASCKEISLEILPLINSIILIINGEWFRFFVQKNDHDLFLIQTENLTDWDEYCAIQP